MKEKLLLVLLVAATACSCTVPKYDDPASLGKFQTGKDLYLAHFDVKTDVDDLHSVAGVATMLADARLSGVRYHAVAGTYGMQEGLYVPANELFDLAFDDHWSDAHADFAQALDEVDDLAIATLNSGGTIWIADAGQSDFSAALLSSVQRQLPETDLKNRVHVVQHADWNEAVTTPDALAFVRHAARYQRLPDGNVVGNGTPGFRSDEPIDWQKHIGNPRLMEIWRTALRIGNAYNGVDDRYLNESIEKGGLDFSDVAETAWIFGFDHIVDANHFFQEFANPKRN